MKIDLHIHTKYSKDSRLELEKIINIAKKGGLNGVAITDHNSFEGVKAVKKLDLNEFFIIPGEEIKTNKGELMGLFLEEEVKSKRYLEVIDEIKSQGGLVVVPHPFDNLRSSRFKEVKKIKNKVDGLEVFNSRVIFNRANEKAMKFADKNHLIKTAGSDAHTRFEIGNAYVKVEAWDLEEFREKLEKGKVNIKGKKSNPLVHLFSTLNEKIG